MLVDATPAVCPAVRSLVQAEIQAVSVHVRIIVLRAGVVTVERVEPAMRGSVCPAPVTWGGIVPYKKCYFVRCCSEMLRNNGGTLKCNTQGAIAPTYHAFSKGRWIFGMQKAFLKHETITAQAVTHVPLSHDMGGKAERREKLREQALVEGQSVRFQGFQHAGSLRGFI